MCLKLSAEKGQFSNGTRILADPVLEGQVDTVSEGYAMLQLLHSPLLIHKPRISSCKIEMTCAVLLSKASISGSAQDIWV